MKHLKAANRKARAVEAVRTGGNVVGMVQPMGCTTIFNPGWEADPWGSAHAMCSPTEADLAGCSGVCWWPAQVPDSLQNYPEWAKGCSGVNMEDWRSLNVEFPKVKYYGRRTLYIDKDTLFPLAVDLYDAGGKLYKMILLFNLVVGIANTQDHLLTLAPAAGYAANFQDENASTYIGTVPCIDHDCDAGGWTNVSRYGTADGLMKIAQ